MNQEAQYSCKVLLTTGLLDDREPLHLSTRDMQWFWHRMRLLEDNHLPMQFDLDKRHVPQMMDMAYNRISGLMILFLKEGSWTQYYDPPENHPFKIFTRRALKKLIPKRFAVSREPKVRFLASKYEPSVQIERAIEAEEYVQPQPLKSMCCRRSRAAKKKQVDTLEREPMTETYNDYIRDNEAIQESVDKLKALKISMYTLTHEYKYSVRMADLNLTKSANEGLSSYLLYMAMKSKLARCSYTERMMLEDALTDGSFDDILHRATTASRCEEEELIEPKTSTPQETSKEIDPTSFVENLFSNLEVGTGDDLVCDGPSNQSDSQERDSHGTMGINADQQGNVVLTTQRVESKPRTLISRGVGFLPPSSARESQNLEQLTKRWIEAGHFIWEMTDPFNKEIDKNLPMILPLVALQNNLNSPNIAPFKIHEYARFDMRIRIQVNSNKFQTGMLQASWFYNKSLNKEFSIYDNVYSASQRIHGLVSAGSSNDIVLDIPYWALTSAMPLKRGDSDKDFLSFLDMGSLSIKVLNPLQAATGVSKTAGVTVWVSFENIEFRAMKSMTLDTPFSNQMDEVGSVISAAKDITSSIDKCYSQLTGHKHTDNPPVSVVPTIFQPTASHSFCVVDEQPNVLEILRAQPLNQTPVVPGSSNRNTELSELTSKWSYFDTITWKTGDSRGKSLWDRYSTPNALSSYKSETVGNAKLYYPTILNFLSDFFGYWSGELELRLDFVANDFYSGRVGMYTVPNLTAPTTYDQARQSAGVVFDLQEGHQFIYKIPYYNNTPFCPNYDSTAEYATSTPPSITQLFVLNELVASDNIPPQIDINIYVRGASNFEFSLLKTPNTSVFFNKTILLDGLEGANIDSNWAQAFVSGSRWLNYGGKQYCSLFYNQTTDWFTQFDNLDFNTVYEVPQYQKFNDKYNLFMIPYYVDKNSLGRVTHLVRANQYRNYPVVVCFADGAKAKAYADNPNDSSKLQGAIIEVQQGPWVLEKIVDELPTPVVFPKTTTAATASGWRDISDRQLPAYKFPKVQNYEDFEFVNQSDETEIEEMPSISLAQVSEPTDHGKRVFGEKITSIKEMCRRYQYLGCQVVSTSGTSVCLSTLTPSLVLSTHPVRRFNVTSPNDRDNHMREGFITNLISMYAGYRGSMRYRLILSDWDVNSTASVCVVHKFQEPFQPQKESVSLSTNTNKNFRTFLDTSFSTKIQCTVVNSVVEFEVPFYSTAEYNSIYPPPISNAKLIQNYMQSGEIWVYISTVKAVKVAVDVFYSLGDDFDLSCFQGIPQNMDLYPLAQNDTEEKVVAMDHGVFDLLSTGISTAVERVQQTINIPKNIETVSQKLGAASDSVEALSTATLDSLEKTKSTVFSGFSSLMDKVPKMTSLTSILTSLTNAGGFISVVILQLLYVIISPSPATIAIACFSILSLLIGVNDIIAGYVKEFVLVCINWLQRYLTPSPVQQNEEACDLSKVTSLLWSIISGSLGVATMIKKPSDSICSGLFNMSGNIFRTHVFGTKFFTDLFELIQRMYTYINRWIAKDYPLANLVKEEDVKKWIVESTAILDESVREEATKNKMWTSKLFQLQSQGSVISAAARSSGNSYPPTIVNSITTLYKDLSQRVHDLKKTNSFAPFRREPHVIWLHSDRGGAGKSKFAENLILELAKKFNLCPDYFKLTAGQKYFDGLTTEKFVLLDDFLATQSTDTGEILGQFLQMVGSSKLQLPRARVEDKLTFDDFEFLLCTSNFANFSVENTARCKDAFDRRRHIVVEFIGKNYQDTRYKVTRCAKLKGDETLLLNSTQELIDLILADASCYRVKQDLIFQEQMTAYKSALDNTGQMTSVDDYIEKFKLRLVESKAPFSSLEWVESWFKKLLPETKKRFSDLQRKVYSEIENVPHQKLKENIGEELKEITISSIPCKPFTDEEIEKYIVKLEEEEAALMEGEFSEASSSASISTDDFLSRINSYKTTTESIFKPHPYHTEIHQDEFMLNLDINTLDLSPFIHTTSKKVCMCASLRNPVFLRFDMRAVLKWLNVLLADNLITEEWKQKFLFKCSTGIIIDFSLGSEGSAWLNCDHAEKKKFGPKRLGSAHELVDSKIWCHVWSMLNGRDYKIEDLKRAVPSRMFHKVEDIEAVSGWKLILKEEKLKGIVCRLRQIMNCWPKSVTVGDVCHPFPKDYDTDAFDKILNPTLLERWRTVIGGKRVTQDDGSKLWLFPKWVLMLKSIASVLAILTILIASFKLIVNIVRLFVFGNGIRDQMLTSGALSTGKTSGGIKLAARSLLNTQGNLNDIEQTFAEDTEMINGRSTSGRLKKVLRNVCFIVTHRSVGDSARYTQARCLGAYNNRVIMCKHYLEHVQKLQNKYPETEVFLVRRLLKGSTYVTYKQPIHIKNFKVFEYGYDGKEVGDMCLVDVGLLSTTFGDIRHFMPMAQSTNENLAHQINYPKNMVLIEPQLSGTVNINRIHATFSDSEIPINLGSDNKVWTIGPRFKYNLGGPGMCGSFLWNESSQYPLLGFHTSGWGTELGFSELLLREEYFPEEPPIEHAESNMDFDEKEFADLEGTFEPVGTIPNVMKPHIPRTSRIIPSVAYGLFETKTEPAPLAKTDPRLDEPKDPLIVGVNKRFRPMIPFDIEDVKDAQTDLLNKLYCVKPIITLRKLTIKESIEGLRGIPHNSAIEMSTSEGYPWIKMRSPQAMNKCWLFKLGQYDDGSYKYEGMDSFLEKTLTVKEQLRKRGRVPVSFYTAMLKDARILSSKIHESGKTRVFEMSPIDLTIAQRQFQLPFILTYMNNNLKCENTIGMNVNGYEWNNLAYNLLDFSPHILAGDYSSYGPRIDQTVLLYALGVIREWSLYWDWHKDVYSNFHTNYEWDEIREWEMLDREIVTSPLVIDRKVVRPMAGMASGNAATVIINSLVNSIYIRCIYLELARIHDPEKASLHVFRNYVRMFSNGDDIIMSVKEEIIEWFNNHTLTKQFELHDLKYTNSKKDGSNPKFEALDQVAYLKCQFKPHPVRCGYWLAALDKVSIEDCPQWIWKSEVDKIEATLQNCDQAIRLAYGHGPKYFSLIKHKIRHWAYDRDLFVEDISWEELDTMVWDKNQMIVKVM